MKISVQLIQKLVFVLISVSFAQIVDSQEIYNDGYVVLPTGDTLHGFIRHYGSDPNSYKVSFKSTLNGAKTEYSPLEIKAYGVKGEKYVSAIVETETSPDLSHGLDNNDLLNFKLDTAFLQTVVEGPKSLYYLTTRSGKNQFYIKTDAGFELLVYKMYTKVNEGRTKIAENRKYLGQLVYYFQDCPKFATQLNGKSYLLGDLHHLFDFYYAHTNHGIKFQKVREKIAVKFGALAGVSNTSLTFDGKSIDYIYLVGAHYTKSTDFTGGASVELIIPGFDKALSLNNEMIYSSYQIKGQYLGFQYENMIINTTLAYSYVTLKNIVRYQFPVKKIKLFVDAGVTSGRVMKETNERTTIHTLPTNTIITHLPAIYETQKYEFGVLVGGGLKIKHYLFEVRYEQGGGMKSSSSVSSTSHRIACLVGYTF